MSRSNKAFPFKDTFEHVEAELDWLKARCARVTAEAKQREVEQEQADADPAYKNRPGRTDVRMASCRVRECREEEDRIRAEIDARLALTPDTVPLGLVQVMRDHGLGTDEKTVLLVALAHAIGAQHEERILGPVLPSTFSGPDVADMLRILDPQGLEAHVKARGLYRPKSALMRSGLLVLDDARSGVGAADTLLGLGVRLSLRGWAAILHDEDALTEGATPSVTNGH